MEGENKPVSVNADENKSNSLLWSIIAVVIVIALGYLLLASKDNEDKINNNIDDTNQVSGDSIGTQSDSSDVNSIEADMEATNFNSLDVEMQ